MSSLAQVPRYLGPAHYEGPVVGGSAVEAEVTVPRHLFPQSRLLAGLMCGIPSGLGHPREIVLATHSKYSL